MYKQEWKSRKEATCNINGNSECVNRNRLISDLINNKRKVSITTQRDPNNWFKAKMDRDGKQQEKRVNVYI